MIECITFTGVDERTDLARARRIAEASAVPVEFGVLVGSSTWVSRSADSGRFPCQPVVEAAAMTLPRTALHLCGRWSRGAMAGETWVHDFIERIGVPRVQLNLRPQDYDPAKVGAFCDATAAQRVVVQYRGNRFDTLFLHHRKLEALHDRSGGRGLSGAWPDPPAPGKGAWCEGRAWGYAGGLGPDAGQVRRIADMARQAERAGARVWFDMEAGVRTDGHFDLSKVERVLDGLSRELAPPAACKAPAP